jgi:hypothetical protein
MPFFISLYECLLDFDENVSIFFPVNLYAIELPNDDSERGA